MVLVRATEDLDTVEPLAALALSPPLIASSNIRMTFKLE
jgi:hypothetical protein